MMDLSPNEFENFVKKVFENKGFDVEKTSKTKNGGKI